MLKFSIIVPVYNTGAYLEECIDSVLQQTYTWYELILIDDGSTDSSGQLCDEYANLNPGRIIVEHNPNQGPLISRMRGIGIAHGDILLFLDSDDCLRKDALELLVGFFTTYDCDMVLFDAQESSYYTSRAIKHPFQQGELFQGESKKRLYQELVKSRILNSVCLKALRRECARMPEYVSQCGRLKHGEDLLLSACFITGASKIAYMDQGIYYYRMRTDSVTHSFDAELKNSLKKVHAVIDRLVNVWQLPELESIHNTRKVRGWIDTLMMLLINKKAMSNHVFYSELRGMAEDSYFVSAYQKMDRAYLPYKYKVLAYCLRNKCYTNLIIFSFVMRLKLLVQH